MNRVLFGLVLLATPAFAQQQEDRAALITQTLVAQAQAANGAARLCQMDAADLKKHLDAANAELTKLKGEVK